MRRREFIQVLVLFGGSLVPCRAGPAVGVGGGRIST